MVAQQVTLNCNLNEYNLVAKERTCHSGGVEASLSLKFQKNKDHRGKDSLGLGHETLAQKEHRTDTNHSEVIITRSLLIII